MIEPGEIISYPQMCLAEGGQSLQRGMNFQSKGGATIILMSQRKGAPYSDKTENDGKTLIYEGHDSQKNWAKIPKNVDQPLKTPTGRLTENGKFFHAAEGYKKKKNEAELVKVYEKIKDGIWVYNGVFELKDAWLEKSGKRKVFKFRLDITDQTLESAQQKRPAPKDLVHNRMIPTSVKLEVWKRDGGKCKECGSTNNLHFDHVLPFSKGGTSLKAENIQLLCARHNLQKSDNII